MPSPSPSSSALSLETVLPPGGGGRAADVLAGLSGLSKGAVKDAMAKGAAWWRRGDRGPTVRLRRATTSLRPGDRVAFHYDPAILSLTFPEAVLVRDLGPYTAWRKPAGLLSQGTPFGDHGALLRQAERRLAPRPALLVHRLDREAEGLMLVAHTPRAAARLSALFREGKIEKTYRVEVRGSWQGPPRLDAPLDGKDAVTEVLSAVPAPDGSFSTLAVRTRTGRRHQIRRHLDRAGHPVLGDPRYGHDNRDERGLRLAAVGLRFRCPLTGKEVDLRLPELDGALKSEQQT